MGSFLKSILAGYNLDIVIEDMHNTLFNDTSASWHSSLVLPKTCLHFHNGGYNIIIVPYGSKSKLTCYKQAKTRHDAIAYTLCIHAIQAPSTLIVLLWNNPRTMLCSVHFIGMILGKVKVFFKLQLHLSIQHLTKRMFTLWLNSHYTTEALQVTHQRLQGALHITTSIYECYCEQVLV